MKNPKPMRRSTASATSTSRRRGFTITEMLVVMAIIALVMGFVFVDYMKNSRADRTKSAVRTLQAAAVGARTNAVSARESVVLIITTTTRLGVTIAPDSSKYMFGFKGDTSARCWLYALPKASLDALVADATNNIDDYDGAYKLDYGPRTLRALMQAMTGEPRVVPDNVAIYTQWTVEKHEASPSLSLDSDFNPTSSDPEKNRKPIHVRVTLNPDGSIDNNVTHTTATRFVVVDQKDPEQKEFVRVIRSTGELIIGE